MATVHAKAVARHWGLPVPGHLKHGKGSYAGKVYGCACPLCLPSGRRATRPDRIPTHAERQRRLRTAKRRRPVPAGTKHGIYAYQVYQCRCDVCVKVHAENLARHRNAWRATARGHWSDLPDVTVVHWPPTGTGADWVCPHCGRQPRGGIGS